MKLEFKPGPRGKLWETTPTHQWTDWRWQNQKSLKVMSDFASAFQLSSSEHDAMEARTKEQFQMRTTPYYASLADGIDPRDPLRRIQIPNSREMQLGSQQMLDPLGEIKNRRSRRLIHRYPDRVLLLVTDFCSVYCRYCTRKYYTGHDQALIDSSDYAEALKYIRQHPGIREVILSGGDPLTLSDDQLEKILSDLRKIEHVEIIRVGSRIPTVNPFRMTDDLSKLFRKYKPVYLMTHFSHPKELTLEAAEGLERIVDRGTPIFNQFVLLNGINNHEAIVQALSRRLMYLRVKPYYMFQCDPSMGTDHLRTSVEDSLSIQRELWGRLSGLAMPHLSLDIPNGGGKVGLVPEFQVSHEGRERTYRGWDGVKDVYISPPENEIQKPSDVHLYLDEWESLKNAREKKRITPAPAEHISPQIF